MTPPDRVSIQFRFPLPSGDLQGALTTLAFTGGPGLLDVVRDAVPVAEPCEAGCGALVGPSSTLSGNVERFNLPEPLDTMPMPDGLWEQAHEEQAHEEPVDDVEDPREPNPDTATVVVFHNALRCRQLRGLQPLDDEDGR